MHIPDGFLSTPVWAGLDAAAVPAVGYLARRAQAGLEESRVALLGVMGAFVFAAQMINFPVGIGTSGHLVGSALLAITLGPAPAAVVMTAILAIQALIFQDGGLLALGANVLNMAVAGVLTGYLPFHYLGRGRGRSAAIFLGGMLSVFVAASLAMSELLVSGIRIPAPILGISTALFLVSAAIEGAITLAAFRALEALNPRFIRQAETGKSQLAWLLLVVAIFLASVGVLFASAWPDGLERLAEQVGVAGRARNLISTPFTDYEAGFAGSAWLRKATAGLAGLVSIYTVCVLFARVARRRRNA